MSSSPSSLASSFWGSREIADEPEREPFSVMFPNYDSASSFCVYMMDALSILDLWSPPRRAFTPTLALIAARRPYGGRRLRGARAPYGRRRCPVGLQAACTSPGHLVSCTRSRVAMAGTPSVGTSNAVELSRTPRRRLPMSHQNPLQRQ